MGPFEAHVRRLVESELTVSDADKLYTSVARAWLEFDRVKSPQTADNLWTVARELAFWVVQAKRLTPAIAKAARHFTTVDDDGTTLTRVLAGRTALKVLLQTRSAAERDSNTRVTVGEFTVHNLVNASPAEFQQIARVVAAASVRIGRSGLARAKEILYGDVYLTDQLVRADTLAMYRRKQDTIWVRAKIQADLNAVHNLVHELGHRYWSLYLPTKAKTAWKVWDMKLRSVRPGRPALPAKGEPIPVTIKGYHNPVAHVIRGDKFYLDPTHYVTAAQIERAQLKRSFWDRFPTSYAADSDSPEEHFCEAFAMYCQGVLMAPHLDTFRGIF